MKFELGFRTRNVVPRRMCALEQFYSIDFGVFIKLEEKHGFAFSWSTEDFLVLKGEEKMELNITKLTGSKNKQWKMARVPS
jgi:hypothetical protein